MSKAKVTANIAGKVTKEAMQPTQPMVGAGSLVAMRDGDMCEVITVRTYMSNSRNASVVKACVWVRPANGNDWRSGRGEAGGWGYHKESQAIADAVRNAGIALYGDPYGRDGSRNKEPLHFGGTGSSYYEEIFRAIARAAGYKGRMAWVTHGL